MLSNCLPTFPTNSLISQTLYQILSKALATIRASPKLSTYQNVVTFIFFPDYIHHKFLTLRNERGSFKYFTQFSFEIWQPSLHVTFS